LIKLQELCNKLDIICQLNTTVSGLNTLKDANNTEVSFLENKKYIHDLSKTKAIAVFVREEFAKEVPKETMALICDKPYLTLAKASYFFKKDLILANGKKAIIGENTQIMPNVHLGKNVQIGNNTTIMSGSFIGDNVIIGSNTIIYPNVSIYYDCKIGSNVIIHSGTVIGCDGFGFTPTGDGSYTKIYQNGNVILENNIEIGSNCTIDRAVFNSTIIKSHARLDNLVHIAHNCVIGTGCILTGQVGIAGSTTLHEYVVMAGQSGANGHIEIAAFSTISARGVVTKTIKEPKKQWSGFPLIEHKTWMRLQAKISRLLKS
jgi:UDP-3-O-[3-hydroxymyristoyl] glucosamine N-acyltransferase